MWESPDNTSEGADAFQRKLRDELFRRGCEEAGAPTENTAPKPYQEALDKFLGGDWLDQEEWGAAGVSERWVNSTWTKPQWAVQVHSLTTSGSFGPDRIKPAISEWLRKERTDTIGLSSTAPARHFLTALTLLAEGHEDQIRDSHINALEHGQQILTDLAETRKPQVHALPLELAQQKKSSPHQKKGGPLIENMGEVAGGAYKEILLPKLQPIIDAEKQRIREIARAFEK